MSGRHWPKKALLALLSLTISLLLAEGITRLVFPRERRVLSVNVWDPVAGTVQAPGATGHLHCPEYEIELRINERGLRDRDFPYEKPPGVRRLLCLGDSFTVGYGVSAEETFAKVLERRLAGRAPPRWEVLNAGVGSTGTAHQLAWFRKEGRLYQPDLVVLCFFPGNDFWDNLRSGLFTLRGDSLLQHPAPRTLGRRLQAITRWVPFYGFLSRHSMLLGEIKVRVAAMHHRRLEARATDEAPAPALDLFGPRDRLTLRLLLELQEACRDAGAELLVMTIAPPPESQLPERTAELQRGLEHSGVAVLDLAPRLPPKAEGLVYPIDRHWTAAGHRRVAEILMERLVDLELLGAGRRLEASPRQG